MIEQYKESQSLFYKIIKNAVDNNKLSHAYLIETNENEGVEEIVYALLKFLVCPYKYTDNLKCENCNICNRIDKGNYTEIKIIKPDGLWIKKDQLLELQEEFSKKIIEGNKKIYVIFESEKLNKQAANSILKFLEEPEEGIIAILITSNSNLMLETILSRCQLIKLNKNDTNNDSFIHDDFELKVLNVIDYYEKNKLMTIVNAKSLWHDNFKIKEDISNAIDLMLRFYNDVFRYKSGNEIINFNNNIDLINYVALNNTLVQIINKVEVLIENKDLVKYNLNIGLLFDKIIIEMEGGI